MNMGELGNECQVELVETAFDRGWHTPDRLRVTA